MINLCDFWKMIFSFLLSQVRTPYRFFLTFVLFFFWYVGILDNYWKFKHCNITKQVVMTGRRRDRECGGAIHKEIVFNLKRKKKKSLLWKRWNVQSISLKKCAHVTHHVVQNMYSIIHNDRFISLEINLILVDFQRFLLLFKYFRFAFNFIHHHQTQIKQDSLNFNLCVKHFLESKSCNWFWSKLKQGF